MGNAITNYLSTWLLATVNTDRVNGRLWGPSLHLSISTGSYREEPPNIPSYAYIAQEVRAVILQLEGCRFDPTLGVSKCP